MPELNAGRLTRTVSGIYMDVFDPKPEMIVLKDIATGLGNICRYNGQIDRFYCVAEHSAKVAEKVSRSVKPEWTLEALMHDAAEAYLNDVPRPIKHDLSFSRYREIEERLMQVIAERFLLKWPFHDVVKWADDLVLQEEWDSFVTNDDGSVPLMSSVAARIQFKRLVKELTEERGTYEVLKKTGALS